MVNKRLFTILVIFFSISACSKKFELKSYQIGSNLNSNGKITNKSLTFKFDQFDKRKKYRDLFNYIYFEGDTVCFSFEFTKITSTDNIKIWFINPKTGKKYIAERIDYIDNKKYGFSLVGSLLEHFFYNNLDKKLTSSENIMKIPFEILIEIKNKHYIKKISSQFKIVY